MLAFVENILKDILKSELNGTNFTIHPSFLYSLSNVTYLTKMRH